MSNEPDAPLNSELLFFLEEHREADNRSVDQQSADNGHDHGPSLNDL
jgi:hypothetical protein